MKEKKLVLNQEWCKGCGICEAFCPRNVFVIKHGKTSIQDDTRCIFCGQCEMRCPDYAIHIDSAEEVTEQWVKTC